MIIYYNCGFAGGREESRRLLKAAISEYTGDPGRAERLAAGLKTGRHGKPYMEDFEHFSVSHTGGFWAVLIDRRECGLDIQLGRRCDIVAISRRLYAPADADRIADLAKTGAAKELADREAADEFFRLWTRREALAKALGGSVYESGLPSVAKDSVNIAGSRLVIADIAFPLASDPGMQTRIADGFHSALCLRIGREDAAELPVPEFRALRV